VAPVGGAWDASAAWWLGDIINGAPLAAISVQDYAAIALGGQNLQLAAGLGTLLARLAEGLPVRLGRPVQLVGWDGPGITLQGPWGVLRAAACIVTVSTGVLAAGGLRFSPDLPAELGDAVAGLPMGLLSKVALQARGDGLLQARGDGSLKAREGDSGPGTARDRLDLPAFGRIERPFAGPGDAPMSWICWPFGRPYVVGFIGGPAAWELSRAGPAAAESFARAELARHFGAARVARVFPPGAVVTGWGADPATLGAYTHARVGAAGARAVLRNAALASGRLRFAGEACHPRFAATLGGAWESGEAAAEAVAGLA
jgi:monoamine oxidase